ncbi:hypothetical protein [Reinekea marinisedimentorum]|uniref:Uncharacterized protein n=1 Tax=Reinekea marinisedimentorum TaxID=230495 RepID=A0A4R3HR54_9GAMM|nr:hypothetical protein [Reinekea marinisedimentorum]TCS33973.1 hypothetical protein BCF53_1482 [Reinekea marinisedimentorum]
MADLKELFPEIEKEGWLKKREQSWQQFIKDPEIGRLRKNQIDLLRQYYFFGRIDKDMPLQEFRADLAFMFPVRTARGLDHFYSNYIVSKNLKDTKELITSIEVTAIRGYGGGDLEEYKKFFRYHLGEVCNLEGRKYVFKDGQYEHKPKVIDRLPYLIKEFSRYFNHGLNESVNTEKLEFLYPYFLSCIDAAKDDLSSFYNSFYYLFFFMKGYLEQKVHWHSYSEESYAYMLEFIEEIEKPNSDFPQYLIGLWHEVEFEEDDEDCD